MSTHKKIRTKNRLQYFGLCVFIFCLLFFFPKEAGRSGNVDISEYSMCECRGFESTINVQQSNMYTHYCYGWVSDCKSYLDCPSGDCWHEEEACVCPGTDRWTQALGPCEAMDAANNCVCTHDECSGLQAIGG